MSLVHWIPSEKLVATVAAECHGHAFARKRAQECSWQDRSVAERLVQHDGQLRHKIQNFLTAENALVVLAADVPGHLARIAALVEALFREADGKRVKRAVL